MIKYLIIFLFISCTAEPIVDNKIIAPIPNGLMNQKENAMTDIIMDYRDFETSIFLYNQAKVKVNQMAEYNVLSHSGYFEDAIESGASYYGQCVSYNYVSAESNVQGFVTSSSHWNIIMNTNYDKIAVACEGLYTVVLVASWNQSNKKVVIELAKIENE